MIKIFFLSIFISFLGLHFAQAQQGPSCSDHAIHVFHSKSHAKVHKEKIKIKNDEEKDFFKQHISPSMKKILKLPDSEKIKAIESYFFKHTGRSGTPDEELWPDYMIGTYHYLTLQHFDVSIVRIDDEFLLEVTSVPDQFAYFQKLLRRTKSEGFKKLYIQQSTELGYYKLKNHFIVLSPVPFIDALKQQKGHTTFLHEILHSHGGARRLKGQSSVLSFTFEWEQEASKNYRIPYLGKFFIAEEIYNHVREHIFKLRRQEYDYEMDIAAEISGFIIDHKDEFLKELSSIKLTDNGELSFVKVPMDNTNVKMLLYDPLPNELKNLLDAYQKETTEGKIQITNKIRSILEMKFLILVDLAYTVIDFHQTYDDQMQSLHLIINTSYNVRKTPFEESPEKQRFSQLLFELDHKIKHIVAFDLQP